MLGFWFGGFAGTSSSDLEGLLSYVLLVGEPKVP